MLIRHSPDLQADNSILPWCCAALRVALDLVSVISTRWRAKHENICGILYHSIDFRILCTFTESVQHA
jgi:hypothetical protein